MRLLITGLNGTLAPVVADAARAQGHSVLGWDRQAVDPADQAASRHWLDAQRLDAVIHLAMGGPEWVALLGAHAAERGLPMVFTSTAMVFDAEPNGPHGLSDARSAKDDYGRYKIACEDALRAACPQAWVARIGWQIDPERAGNNMLTALDDWQRSQGEVACSSAWVPACSFMADTAAGLLALLHTPGGGVAHLDSNAADAWTFDRLVAALKTRFSREAWRIRVHEDYLHDQRLVGGPLQLPPLSERLSGQTKLLLNR